MDKKKRDKAKTHYLVHKKFSINANFKSDRRGYRSKASENE